MPNHYLNSLAPAFFSKTGDLNQPISNPLPPSVAPAPSVSSQHEKKYTTNLFVGQIPHYYTEFMLEEMLNGLVGKKCATHATILSNEGVEKCAFVHISDEASLVKILDLNYQVPYEVFDYTGASNTLLFVFERKRSTTSHALPQQRYATVPCQSRFFQHSPFEVDARPKKVDKNLFIGQLSASFTDEGIIYRLNAIGGDGCVKSFRRASANTAFADISNPESLKLILDANNTDAVSYQNCDRTYFINFQIAKNMIHAVSPDLLQRTP